MNYRHIYHAGNICDIVKHATLTLLIERMKQKESPFTILDTHAGAGFYDLEDERAQKTEESEVGFQRLMQSDELPELSAYYRILEGINHEGDERYYPGSPFLARRLLRPDDRLIACDLHPEEARALRLLFKEDPQVHIHQRDGYEALSALLPPDTKRGLALIDPPYEEANEYQKLVRSFDAAYKRWPTGQYMIWYPIKDRPTLWLWKESMAALNIPKLLCAEFVYSPDNRTDRLSGSGLMIANPPWQFDELLRTVFEGLHEAMDTTHKGISIEWLATEKSL